MAGPMTEMVLAHAFGRRGHTQKRRVGRRPTAGACLARAAASRTCPASTSSASPGSTRNSRQRWSALAGTPPIPPAALAARRLTVRYQRLDRRGRHGGPASDMGGDARGVAVAAVEGPVVQPRPDCHRPPLDAVRRLRPHMQRRGTGAGKQNEHENLPAAGQTRSRGSRHRHEGRSEAHRARPSPQMQLPSGLSPTQASSAYPPPGPQAHDGPMGDGDSSPVACPLPTGLRR